MSQPTHVEIPGKAMLHLAPSRGARPAELIVKRWKEGRWSVVGRYRGTDADMDRLLVVEMGRLDEGWEEYKQRRAMRHVGE